MGPFIRHINYLAIGAAFCVLTSCGTFELITGKTPEERKCNRQARKVERAVQKCPAMKMEPIVIRDTVTVTVEAVKVDTVVAKADTIEIVRDRWRVRIIDKIDSLYIDGGCDSIYVYVPVEVECPPQVQPTIVQTKPGRIWWLLLLLAFITGIAVYRGIKR